MERRSWVPKHKTFGLLVISDRVQLPNVFNAVPCGEYDGYADWQTMDDGERHMTAVQVMIDEEGLGRMRKSGGIPLWIGKSCDI